MLFHFSALLRMTDFGTCLPYLNTHFLTKRKFLISYSIIHLGLMIGRLVCYCHTFMTTWGFVSPCSKRGEKEAFIAAYTTGLQEGNSHLAASMVWFFYSSPQAIERTVSHIGLTAQPWPSWLQQDRAPLILPQMVTPHMYLQ